MLHLPVYGWGEERHVNVRGKIARQSVDNAQLEPMASLKCTMKHRVEERIKQK